MKKGAALWRAVIDQAKSDLREQHAQVVKRLPLLDRLPSKGRTVRDLERLRKLEIAIAAWREARAWLFGSTCAELCRLVESSSVTERGTVQDELFLPRSCGELDKALRRAREAD